MRPFAILPLMLSLAAGAAQANTIFFDDFEADLDGRASVAEINARLNSFEIVSGSVDLFTNGGFGLPCGSAGCLDLDGTTGTAARLESVDSFSFSAGRSYMLSLGISGKNRNNEENLIFGIADDSGDLFGQALTMVQGDNAARIATLKFVAVDDFAGTLFIDHEGGDYYGILLDYVDLSEASDASPVPVPAGLPLLGSAIALAGFISRRKRG